MRGGLWIQRIDAASYFLVDVVQHQSEVGIGCPVANPELRVRLHDAIRNLEGIRESPAEIHRRRVHLAIAAAATSNNDASYDSSGHPGGTRKLVYGASGVQRQHLSAEPFF